jgi:hypothetical protein
MTALKVKTTINHVALVLDASGSMSGVRSDLIRVVDAQIKYLARRSQEMNQETRVSVYSFDDTVKPLVFDTDVLRLPSIAEIYRIGGLTTLLSATMRSQKDLATTSQIYGDHSFLTFVLTDGQENHSAAYDGTRPDHVKRLLDEQADNWTVAVLVPDMRGKREAQGFGFPKDNIAVWDVNESIDEVGTVIQTATDNFMTMRASGGRGSRNVFSAGVDAVNDETVKSNLTPMPHGSYVLARVTHDTRMDDFLNNNHAPYRAGKGFYEFSPEARKRAKSGKKVKIQGNKNIVIVEKATGTAYTGIDAIRGILGIGKDTVEVPPMENPKYAVFVQSTAGNRGLYAGSQVLIVP